VYLIAESTDRLPFVAFMKTNMKHRLEFVALYVQIVIADEWL
jgi:hypothetical protein